MSKSDTLIAPGVAPEQSFPVMDSVENNALLPVVQLNERESNHRTIRRLVTGLLPRGGNLDSEFGYPLSSDVIPDSSGLGAEARLQRQQEALISKLSIMLRAERTYGAPVGSTVQLPLSVPEDYRAPKVHSADLMASLERIQLHHRNPQ